MASFILVLSLCLSLSNKSAHAVTSLPYIEQLKSSLSMQGNSFVILEIVPDDGSTNAAQFTGSGSIGYYIDGSEPCADWLDAVKALSGKSARANYANTLFSQLESAQLLSDTDATPLTLTANYDEAYPWETDKLSGKTAVTLDTPDENIPVRGTFSPKPAGGDYEAIWEYPLNDTNGDGTGDIGIGNDGVNYIQDVSILTYGISGDNYEYYYLNPQFEIVTAKQLVSGGDTPDDPSDDVYEYVSLKNGTVIYKDAYTLAGTVVIAEDGTASISFADGFSAGEGQQYYTRELDNVYVPLTGNISSLADGIELYAAAGYKEYVGVAGSGISLNAEVQYYTLSSAGAPVRADSRAEGILYYAAESSSYILAGDTNKNGSIDENEIPGKGYFRRILSGYEFVGDEDNDGILDGKYDFSYDENGADQSYITCSTIYYQGGFTNNNWFLKYVFNMDSGYDKISFIVNSITPYDMKNGRINVTSEMVDSADLIVLSAGQDISGSGLSTNYNGDVSGNEFNDLYDPAALEIYNRAAANTAESCPIIVDYRLTAADSGNMTNISKLAQLIVSNSASGTLSQTDIGSLQLLYGGLEWQVPSDTDFVKDNIYCINNGVTNIPLATKFFHAQMDDTGGFESVLEEIIYENFLRRNENPSIPESELLPEEISIANTVRYIISFGGQRTVSVKTELDVLEIQPGSGQKLSKTDVLSWLDNNSGITEADINIVTMSTAEFVGKIEDLNENYDMIYIGSSTTGFNTFASNTIIDGITYDQGTTRYNDKSMNGLIYSNIGDKYSASLRLAGLLDSDFAVQDGTVGVNGTSTSTANVFRFSGNDITAKKMQDIQNFAAAGYPIIFENDLLFPVNPQENNFNIIVTISAAENSSATFGDYDLRATVSGAADLEYTSVRWYRTGSSTPIDTTSGLAITRTAETTSYTYYCRVYFGTEGEYAQSNQITLQATAGGINHKGNDTSTYETGGYYLNYTYQFGGVGNRRYVDLDYVKAEPVISFSSSNGRNQLSADLNYLYDYSIYYTKGKSGYLEDVTGGTSLPNNPTLPVTVHYAWYRMGSGTVLGTDRTLNIDALGSGKYYCVISFICDYQYYSFSGSNAETAAAEIEVLERFVNITDDRTSYPLTYTVESALYLTSADIDSGKVDSSSIMYDTLNSIKSRENVMTVFEANQNHATVLSYINLSKPEIVWADPKDNEGDASYSYPYEYAMNGNIPTSLTPVTDSNGAERYYLIYEFHIRNDTDATPNTTKYDCCLYIDLNSDGKYSETEEITDVTIRKASDNSLVNPNEDGVYSLSANVGYVLARLMPTDYVGILPWKLEVIKNGATHIHASEHNYTRIAPDDGQATQITILQIKGSGSVIDLEAQLTAAPYKTITVNNTGIRYSGYTGIYGALLNDLEDFNVRIHTLEISEFDNISAASFSNGTLSSDLVDFLSGRGVTAENITQENFVQSFDMLIIGFADMYGTFSQSSASAIVKYIDSGKAVLFTHDTTSLTNLEDGVNTPLINSTSASGTNYASGKTWQSGYGTMPLTFGTVLNPTFYWRNAVVGGQYYNYYGSDGGAYLSMSLNTGNYTITATVQNTGSGSVEVGVEGSGVSSKVRTFVEQGQTKDVILNFTVNNSYGNVSPFFYAYNGASANVTNYIIKRSDIGTIASVSGPEFWGYSFNSILRDAVGLDRYGTTSLSEITLSDYSTASISSIIKASSLSADDASKVQDSGYTVAYIPKTSSVDSRTQGYTNYSLIRYGASDLKYTDNTYSARETTYISQVNEGQITTYPYNINTLAFKGTDPTIGSSNYMKIGNTHEQYYQLNMNSDDIVVWYCLSSGTASNTNSYYDDRPNDVVNAYYIYSKGNITYSGVGHTASQALYTGTTISAEYVNEAKLFVNTMIAAYRTVNEAPMVEFTEDAAGMTDAQYYFLSSTASVRDEETSVVSDVLLESSMGESDENCVYFKLTDPNLNRQKTIRVNFYYTTNDTIENLSIMSDDIMEFSPVLYEAESGSIADTASLRNRNLVYKFYIPSGLLDALSPRSVNTVRLFIRATTTISGVSYESFDSVDLRKMSLSILK